MPEGPSIIILKEAVQDFKGKKIVEVTGNAKIEFPKLLNQKIIDFKTWGKHFLICFNRFTIRIHLLMFGTYKINERKDTIPRLGLKFDTGELNFYTCSVQIINVPLDEIYDWSSDIMSPTWNPQKAIRKINAKKDEFVCDVLLDQNIFSGVGNIIKNEVLYNISIHPEYLIKNLTKNKITELVSEASSYSYKFLNWKSKFILRKHWLVYKQKLCSRDGTTILNIKTGKTNRRSYFCPECQKNKG